MLKFLTPFPAVIILPRHGLGTAPGREGEEIEA